jgi:hypothetical protein
MNPDEVVAKQFKAVAAAWFSRFRLNPFDQLVYRRSEARALQFCRSTKEAETPLSGFLVPRAGKNGQAWIFLKLGIDESQLTEKKDGTTI